MGKVSVNDKTRIQTLCDMSKDWDIARSRQNTQRKTGSWTLLSLSANTSMKRDHLSPENQAEVDPDRFVCQR